MFSPDTRLPVIPLHTPFNQTAGEIATLVFSALAAVVLVYSLVHWRKTKSPLMLMMMIGGVATTLAEPFIDVIGAAWHPIHGQNTAFELMGRPIPVWVVAAYAVFFGVIGSLNYVAFSKGTSMRNVWLWFAVPMVFDVVQEEIMMHWDLYYYYGQQPLILLWKFPLWWPPCNSIGELLGVATLVLMGSSLRGWKLLLIPVIMPIMDVIGYAAVGLPSIVAVNTEGVSPAMANMAGLATYALTGLVVYAVSLLIANDSPLRRASAGSTPIGDLLRRPAVAA